MFNKKRDIPIQHEGRDNCATAQASNEGDRLPMPMRNVIDQPNAAGALASKPHHGGVGEVSSMNPKFIPSSAGQRPPELADKVIERSRVL